MYLYVCIYRYIYIYVCIYTYIHIYTYIYIHIHTTLINIHKYIYTHIYHPGKYQCGIQTRETAKSRLPNRLSNHSLSLSLSLSLFFSLARTRLFPFPSIKSISPPPFRYAQDMGGHTHSLACSYTSKNT